MTGDVLNIEKKSHRNDNFREVLYTAKHSQMVVRSLYPKEEIAIQVHEIVDQFIRKKSGKGKVTLNGEEHIFSDGSAFIVRAGTRHNVINTSAEKQLKP